MTRKHVLFFGSFDLERGYPRARSLIQSLENQGVEVGLLHRSLLPVRGARLKLARSLLRWPRAALRVWWGGIRLRRALRRYLREHHVDVILVPYPGHFAVRWARKLFRGPVVLDMFLSISDTMISDRGMFRQGGLVYRFLRRIDRKACQNADLVLLDTPEHASFVQQLTGFPEEKFSFVPVGDPDAPKDAFPLPGLDPGQPLKVVYVGTGVPLHGVDTVLAACARTEGIHLTFVGGTAAQLETARTISPDKVSIIEDWIGKDTMHRLYAEHHVALGIFGSGEKADRVIPFKLVHALSAGRPAVTAETSAVNTLLDPGWDCLTCPPGDPVALSRSLASLRDESRLLPKISQRARMSYERMFSPRAIGFRLLVHLEALTGAEWLPPDQELDPAGLEDELSRRPSLEGPATREPAGTTPMER
ncbi:MAG: glycosyltransferase [Planctomycetota bacterium]